MIDDALAVGGEEIEARRVETRLSVEVRVNGRGPYRFLVDSGADTSVIGLRIARDLELPLGTPVVLNNMTDSNIVDRVTGVELTLGSSTTSPLQLPVLREEDLGGAGMIGIDALAGQRLMLDFEKRLIRVEDANTPSRLVRGEIVVTARRQRGQLILTEVTAAGLPLNAVVDTGAEITIGNIALRDMLVRRRKAKVETIKATGVTGTTIDLEVAEIPELVLGKVTIRNVLIAFADLPPFKAFGIQDEPSLFLGTDLLEGFRRVSLDFRARKVRFQLRTCGIQGYSRLSSTGAEVCAR